MKRILLFCSGGVLAALCGCASQSVRVQEFYEPNAQTLQTRKDGMKIGALKSETVRTGSPDWSGNKFFNLIGIGK